MLTYTCTYTHPYEYTLSQPNPICTSKIFLWNYHQCDMLIRLLNLTKWEWLMEGRRFHCGEWGPRTCIMVHASSIYTYITWLSPFIWVMSLIIRCFLSSYTPQKTLGTTWMSACTVCVCVCACAHPSSALMMSLSEPHRFCIFALASTRYSFQCFLQ